MALGVKITENDWSKLLSMSPATLKRNLGLKKDSTAKVHKEPAKDGAILLKIENFMTKHLTDNFVALARLVVGLPKNKRSRPELPGDEVTPKRGRTDFGRLGQQFIKAFADTYIALHGNKAGRIELYNTILATAKTRSAELGSADWTTEAIKGRLANSTWRLKQTMRDIARPFHQQ